MAKVLGDDWEGYEGPMRQGLRELDGKAEVKGRGTYASKPLVRVLVYSRAGCGGNSSKVWSKETYFCHDSLGRWMIYLRTSTSGSRLAELQRQ